MLLERAGGKEEALAVADRIAGDLRQPVDVAGRQVHARASIGVRLAAAGGDPDELLRDADVAMYAAAMIRVVVAVGSDPVRRRRDGWPWTCRPDAAATVMAAVARV